jgi:hypothetical protein
VLCRRGDAHPGAQLRFTDHDGHRFQVFLTDQADPDLAALELRHRQRARVEDRIRAAKATGLRNLPFDLVRRNAVWLELVLAAQDLTCWTQALLLDGGLAAAEPKTLRYRLARVVRHARRTILRLQRTGPGPSSSPGRSPAYGPCRCAADAASNAEGLPTPTWVTPRCPPAASRIPRPAAAAPAPPRAGRRTIPARRHTTRQPATPPPPRPHEKPRLVC